MSTLNNLPTGKIEFLQYHQPGLKDGEYKITVTQNVEGSKITSNNQFTTNEKKFFVAGERFHLNPRDIHAVFPPAGSLGEHSNVLPHIIFNRSTLPWERMAADTTNENAPWLALLLFEEDEIEGVINKDEFNAQLDYSDDKDAVWNQLLSKKWIEALIDNYARILPKSEQQPLDSPYDDLKKQLNSLLSVPRIITLNELTTASTNVLKWPTLILERGQKSTDKVSIIDVKWETLQKIIPTKEELAWLSHVRQGTDKDDKLIGDELAIIIANRLPAKGKSRTVHLVSVEKRYNTNSFNSQNAQPTDYIRLVSLKNWRFACSDDRAYKITDKTLAQLTAVSAKLVSLKNQEIVGTKKFLTELAKNLETSELEQYKSLILKFAFYGKQTFKGLLTHLNRTPNTLRLPTNQNPDAENYLKNGYLPLPHYMRQGARTVSWYHGPLATGEHTTDITLPVRAADQLVRYNPTNGLFDVSYAAAWELGRLLALQNKGFSVSLYQWKRSHVQQLRKSEAETIHAPPHLPINPTTNSTQLPKSIETWFNDLHLLKGVPFNYIVPNEPMLPKESIRFFWMDNLWMECLLDGAFSIGRVTTSDYQRDQAHQTSPATLPHNKVTGFLLRSDVVAGWPGLQVDAYKEIVNDESSVPDSDKLKLLRMDRLSANVLLCLFKGEAKTVDIHQKPETLHFGLDVCDGNGNHFCKTLRNNRGEQEEKEINSIPWKDENAKVIDINNLAQEIKTQPEWQGKNFTSAQFALEMIEGVEKVRFVKSGT